MSLTSSFLKSICESVKTYYKGETYYNERRVRITSDGLEDNGKREVVAAVRGSGGMQYQTKLYLSPDGEDLIDYNCNCAAFASYDGICKHIVALALNVNRSLSTQAATVKTDNMALLMLQKYAVKALMDVPPSATGVKLMPTLDVDRRIPKLSFKVGLDRMYVLKNLDQFVAAVKNGETYAYGKNFSFQHCLSAFDEESTQLVQFLLTYYNEKNFIYANDYFYSGGGQNREMFLAPFMLDPFLDLYEGRTIAVEVGNLSEYYTVKTENPRLKLNIKKQDDESYTVQLQKPFCILLGDRHICLAVNQVIYRCDKAFSNATQGLFDSLAQVSRHQLTLAAGDMPMLAATLLPMLSPYMTIVSSSDLTSFQPPTLQSKVYFDMPSPETVIARVEHHYGQRKHMGFQDKNIRKSLDIRGETRLENLMLQFFKKEKAPGELAIWGDEKALYELADHGIAEISQLAEVFATDAFKTMRIKPPVAVSVGIRMESDLLRLQFDVQGMDLSELEQALDSYRKAKKYHRLRDGSFLCLEDSSLSEFSELAQGLDLTAKEIMSGELSVHKYRALHLDALLKQSERIQYDRDGAFKQMIRDVRDVSDADYQIPQSLRYILRNYQKTGYRWLRTIAAYGFGGILADDMGLGKTLQVIALLLARKEEQADHASSIVICPSSLVLNWESEVHKFAPSLTALPVVGIAAYREELIRSADGSVDLFITSYDSLKRDVELYAAFSFQYVIADEAQYMKNQNTQNAKAVKTLRAAVRFALTGTPVENSLAEVWSIFDFLMPGYLYHYAKFRKNFELPIVKQGDENTAKSLRQMVSPFILRRMKKDVLKELPEKIETVLYAELEEAQKKVYLANAVEARKELAAGLGDSGTDRLQILALLTRLRQICCDPALIYENYEAGSAKLELCMELLQSCMESGHRVLLFSQFTSMLRRIAVRLDTAQTSYFTITGETKVSQRLELVNTFNEGDTPIFLISLKAGGTGLNLTGADVVIHYDPWWNNSAQNQASDRAHRIGQTKTVQVYKLIAKDTLEERILEMQKNKSDLADMIVREGDGAFARMSKNEILSLFE